MSEDEQQATGSDDLRLCPTCRMAISVLATRCRYCGETVGRPRKEEASFSIQDLGGERKTTYTVSGNVMDALEAFRAEEITQQEQEQLDREAATQKTSGDGGMPELDAEHRAMAEAVTGDISPRRKREPRKTSPLDNLPQIIGVVVGVPVILGILWFGYGAVTNYIETRNAEEVIEYTSPGLQMIERGEPVTEALISSIEAVEIADTPENRRILDSVRKQFVEEVNALLAENPFRRERLDQASAMTTRAAVQSSNPEIAALRREVEEEVAAYKLILTTIDMAAGTATFKLHNPYFDANEQTVGVGDYVQDRFIVRHVRERSVRLEDTERNAGGRPRKLVANPLKPVTGE